jgi:hypothetical protein
VLTRDQNDGLLLDDETGRTGFLFVRELFRIREDKGVEGEVEDEH